MEVQAEAAQLQAVPETSCVPGQVEVGRCEQKVFVIWACPCRVGQLIEGGVARVES